MVLLLWKLRDKRQLVILYFIIVQNTRAFDYGNVEEKFIDEGKTFVGEDKII